MASAKHLSEDRPCLALHVWTVRNLPDLSVEYLQPL